MALTVLKIVAGVAVACLIAMLMVAVVSGLSASIAALRRRGTRSRPEPDHRSDNPAPGPASTETNGERS